MKKLLLVLTVVSMAALLFTGCFPTTNTPPVITSTPVTAGTIGTAYTYTVTATDADAGDTLTYVVTGPTGMVISSAGVISGWTPAAAGTYAVTVTVSDGTDSVTQSFTITVPSIGPAEITIAVATETPPDADGKIYVKGGSREITVTFPAAVDNPLVKVGTVEVPVFSVDNKVFKGTGLFVGPCDAVLITVSGVCEELCAAKSVVVDSGKPYAKLKAKVAECDCELGYALTITSDWSEETDCEDLLGCCGDDCVGLASWNIKIYDEYPWDDCCVPDPCVEPNAELDGTECPIEITKECIDEVYIPDGDGGHWVDFFDHHFWVIATITDKVGNEIKYYGEVITDPCSDELVSFVELYLDPTSLECTCYAEDPAAADLVIGDCDGTPADACWEEPLEPCPEVTLDPELPMVGEEVTITIDYTLAEKPTGTVAAYVGPAIKLLPFGIPEDARELVLSGPVDDVYTATYIFGQAGTDYIYVTDDCEDCTACKYAVTVLPIPELECPDVSFLPTSPLVGQETSITFTFDRAPTADEDIRAFVGPAIKGMPEGVPEDAAVLPLVQDTVDLKIFYATYTFGSAGTDFIYLVVNCEDCTPCYYPITVRPIEACPEIEWVGAVDAFDDGEDWLKGGDTYTFILTYDHEITDTELYSVRIRDYTSLIPILPSGGLIFDDYRTLADMTASVGNTVFTGTFTPPAAIYIPSNGEEPSYMEYCTPAYVEVEILEPEDCCEPCMFKFNVDATFPKAEIEISTVDCCGWAFLEFDSVPITCDETCCGDECTLLVSWDIDIYDEPPIWYCCDLMPIPDPICKHHGDDCPIDVNMPAECADCCLDTGDYWIITTLEDSVGNINTYYTTITLDGTVGNWIFDIMQERSWICNVIDHGDYSNPFVHGDPWATESGYFVDYGDPCPWPPLFWPTLWP